MEQQQNDNSHASAQTSAEGANLTDMLAAVENRPREIGGKLVDRWFIVGSGAMAPFWRTKEDAEEAANA